MGSQLVCVTVGSALDCEKKGGRDRHSSVLGGPLRPLWVSRSHHRVGCLLAVVVTAPGSLGILGVHQHKNIKEHPTCRAK